MTEPHELAAEDCEKLLAIRHPARVRFLHYYIAGIVFFVFGWLFNVTVSAGLVQYSELSWWLGMSSMSFGLLLVLVGEYRRHYTLYAITTWNLRVRKGSFNKLTTRVFHDEIERVEMSSHPEGRVINLGYVNIYTLESKEKPTLVFADIHNPEGTMELINRVRATSPLPAPWAHIEKTRTVEY
ncbi:MAG: PH domain-containing protein [Candidatus Hermodarchaeota archaeon]